MLGGFWSVAGLDLALDQSSVDHDRAGIPLRAAGDDELARRFRAVGCKRSLGHRVAGHELSQLQGSLEHHGRFEAISADQIRFPFKRNFRFGRDRAVRDEDLGGSGDGHDNDDEREKQRFSHGRFSSIRFSSD